MPAVTTKDVAPSRRSSSCTACAKGWIKQRPETPNRTQATLLEFGITVPKQLANRLARSCHASWKTRKAICQTGLRDSLAQHWAQLQDLDDQVTRMTHQLYQLAYQDPRVARLVTVPGIGPVMAMAFSLVGGQQWPWLIISLRGGIHIRID